MKTLKPIRTLFILTAGAVLSAVGVYFFRLPNHFSTGGAASIGILLGKIAPFLSSSTYTALLNLFFVFIGFLFLGKNFGLRSVYCSVLFSVSLEAMEVFFPLSAPITDQKMLELLFASIIPAFSSALLFSQDASSGGTEVIALIMKKFTAVDTGRALLCVDILFTSSTFFLFDMETGLYSCLGLIIKTTLIDSILDELKRKKALFIITQYPEPVLEYIIQNIHRGATYWEASGAYSKCGRRIILTVVNQSQAVRLQNYLSRIDPSAFILSENTSEIFGNGFMPS